MVEIISKSDGPRREDAAARHFLRENAGTIGKIAQQLGGGRARAPVVAEPAPTGVRRSAPAPKSDAEAKPYVKISLNGRVVAIDFNTGRQLHHFGEIRGQGPTRRFLLATLENRFFTPLEDDLLALLRELDGAATPDDASEERLVHEIESRMRYQL